MLVVMITTAADVNDTEDNFDQAFDEAENESEMYVNTIERARS